MTQYCVCKFRETDTRGYTYSWPGEEPLQVGDQVKVPDRSGDGWKRVTVTEINVDQPSFPTKDIIGLFEPTVEDSLEPEPKPKPQSLADELDDSLPF